MDSTTPTISAFALIGTMSVLGQADMSDANVVSA